MGDVIRFVDSVQVSPGVLFDFNDESPCGVTGFSAAPPALVRANVQTMLQDGSTEAGSVFGDRVIEIDIDLFASSQDASATVLQNLGRLLSDPRGQWLMYQPTGASAPVFFRTRRADIRSIEDVQSSNALRQLELSIPAEPFAYGLPLTGTVVIANNPAASTNPMSTYLPEIQGDVAAPLVCMIGITDLRRRSFAISTQAADSAGTGAPPFFTQTFTPKGGSVINAGSDAEFVDGTKHTVLTYSGGALPHTTLMAEVTVPFGDYRVFARVRFSDTTTPWQLAARSGVDLEGGGASGPIVTPISPVGGPSRQAGPMLVDLGVLRFPFAGPRQDRALGDPPNGASFVGLDTLNPGSSMLSFDLDYILLVPAGVDRAVSATFLKGQNAREDTAGTFSVLVDSESDQMYQIYNGSGAFDAGSPYEWTAVATPKVVPGQINVLHLMRTIGSYDPGPAPATSDLITAQTVLVWTYNPRYLHVRPAAS